MTAAILLGSTAGCTEFATPAELDRPQILAIAAEPPAVRAGERASLELLVAGPEGPVQPAEVSWRAIPPVPEVPALGRVEVNGDGSVIYIAPDQQPDDNPALGLIEAAVTVDDRVLIGTKGVVVGSLMLRNPTLSRLQIGGVDGLSADQVEVSVGTVELDTDIVDGLGEDASVSWYSTLGAIELYRSTPTELVIEEPGEGWLFVVVRDGAGGVTWRQLRLVAN